MMIDRDPEGPFAEALLADGFEDAFMGYGFQFTHAVAVYDILKCIYILVERDGMDHEEAWEYFDFNVTGAWVGDHTPIFMWRHEDMETPDDVA